MGLPPPPGAPPPLPPPPRGEPGGPAPAVPGRGPVAVRPLNLGELLDGAFKLFVANWRTLLVVAGIFIVPAQLLASYLQRDLFGGGLLEMFGNPAEFETFMQTGGTGENLANLVGLVQAVLVLPLVTGVVAAVVAASYLGGTATPGEALAAGLRGWWALIASWVLVMIASLLPFAVGVAGVVLAGVAGLPVPLVVLLGLVLVLGGLVASLVVASLFAATPPAIVVERLGPLGALARSARLLRPRLFAVLGTLVVATLLISVLSVAIGGVPQFIGLMVGDRFGWVIVAVGGSVAGLVTTPLLAIVVTLLYFDGRVRHEALDLQLAADDLAGGGGGWGAPGGFPGR